jgi:hypothetical protein
MNSYLDISVRQGLLSRPGLLCLANVLILWCGGTGTGRSASERVTMVATPHGGIQPQAVVDGQGRLHLLYFKGDPAGGDLFHVRRDAADGHFSEPVRVNSQPGSAIAIGTIRGGQLALGKGGRVHVAWNGSGKATPRAPGGGSPMLYTRSNAEGTAFEPQRNLMRNTSVLDGGGTVAADSTGDVYVAWHALEAGGQPGEDNRRVWVARSTDEGETFAREASAFAEPTGACGCCGMRAFADHNGSVYLLYRSATRKINRDMRLLCSKDKGEGFREALVDRWQIRDCPMSSESFAEGPDVVVAAWETNGQVYFTRINPTTLEASSPQAAPGEGRGRKHPAVALNARGEMILVWTEGTGWQKGGALAWQVYDKSGKPSGEKGRLDRGIPVWSLPAVVAGPDGSFQVIH